jgi:hypothetical protein
MTNRQPLTPHNSKDEEIETLERFQKEAGQQTYLASFLTNDMVRWVYYQIKDDHSTDVYAAWQSTNTKCLEAQEHVRQLEANALKAAQTIADQATKIAELQEGFKAAREMLAQAHIESQSALMKVNDAKELAEARLEKIANLAGNAWLQGQNIAPDQIKRLLKYVPSDDDDD